MEYYLDTNNEAIPLVGIGTWEMGGRHMADTSNDRACIKAIQKAVELGMTHIDTAEKYGNGHTEELVGEALAQMDRDKLFLTSKVAAKNLSYDNILRAVERSLNRLNTDFLDLYLIHAPNPNIPMKESFRALDRLMDEKLIRRYGLSNFDVPQMEEAWNAAQRPIWANQIEYNLITRNQGVFNRDMEKAIIPWCLQHDIVVIPWRPLAKGELANLRSPLLERLCKKYNKSRSQLALNWLVNKPDTLVIPKAINRDHLEENAASVGWQMDNNDYLELDNAWKS